MDNKDQLLAKYLSGECRADEQQLVEDWLDESGENRSELELLQAAWRETLATHHATNEEDVYREIHRRVSGDTQQEIHIMDKEKSTRKLWYRVAASVVLLMASAMLFILFKSEMMTLTHDLSLDDQEIIQVEKKGKRQTVMLSDGSKVTLNQGSTLEFPKKFDADERVVKLSGEAFFDVVKDASRPFIVASDNFNTTVLGTTFNVRDYANQHKSEVNLATGKVMVEMMNNDQQDRMYIQPGQEVIYDKTDQSLIKQPFEVKDKLGWKDDLLYFHEASADEVFQKLEDWYAVEIKLDGVTEKAWKYTASFKGARIQTVLKSIGYTRDFTYEMQGDTVRIKFENK